MSNPAPTGADNGEKSEGITGRFSRLKSVLKRGKSNRGSISSTAALAEPSKTPESNPPIATESAMADIMSPNPVDDPTFVTRPVAHRPLFSNPDRLAKARVLFAKYGLTIDEDEWIVSPREPVERVEKPVRMRVRRQCHRCQTMYGADKICTSCRHTRCKKCPRFPPKKPKQAGDVPQATAAAAAPRPPPGATDLPILEVDPMYQPSSKYILSRPSKTGGQDVVRKPAVQRIRRNCHRCLTLFSSPTATECENCKHIRCKSCPREPPKLHKYPSGYPGDAEPEPELIGREWKTPRRRIRWTCHSCQHLFKENEKMCPQCSHARCGECIRVPPKKDKKALDPELLRRVEAKLAQLNVESSPVQQAVT